MPGTLAERVRSARESAGLTQVEAAIAAGVSLTALRNIEQGITTDPRVSTVERIFSALDGHHDRDPATPANGRGTNDQAPTADSPQSSAVGAR